MNGFNSLTELVIYPRKLIEKFYVLNAGKLLAVSKKEDIINFILVIIILFLQVISTHQKQRYASLPIVTINFSLNQKQVKSSSILHSYILKLHLDLKHISNICRKTKVSKTNPLSRNKI